MNNPWQDFNNADEQHNFDLIPKGTAVKVRMTLQPGGYDNAAHGWTGGYASLSQATGSIYLQAEFVVLEGEYARRRIWSNIGLYSPNGPKWGEMGRAFIKALLNSAYGLNPQDNSPAAQQKRLISGFESIDGLTFVGRVEYEVDQYGDKRNVLKAVITPDHREYATVMGRVVPPAPSQPLMAKPAAVVPTATPAPKAPNVPNRPHWA